MIQRGIRPTGQGSKTTTTEKTKVSVWVGSGWRCCAESAGETVFDPVTHSADKCVRAGVKVWRYDVRSRSDTHTHTDCTHSGVFVLDASHPVTFLEDATWRHFIGSVCSQCSQSKTTQWHNKPRGVDGRHRRSLSSSLVRSWCLLPARWCHWGSSTWTHLNLRTLKISLRLVYIQSYSSATCFFSISSLNITSC